MKDDEVRDVPIFDGIFDGLLPWLRWWRAKTGGQGSFSRPPYPPGAGGGPASPSRFIRERTMWRHLELALRFCGLPRLTWYQATKHTMASHWLMKERSIAKLATILGHSDAEVSRRYGHIRPDLHTPEDRAALPGTVAHGDFQAGLQAPDAGKNGQLLGNSRIASGAPREQII